MSTTTQPAPTTALEDPSQPVVVFDHVSIGFEGKQVLEDISLTVSPGDTRILLGPAGSGKERSTQARERPDAARQGNHYDLRPGDQ